MFTGHGFGRDRRRGLIADPVRPAARDGFGRRHIGAVMDELFERIGASLSAEELDRRELGE